jgi:pyruvate dehydrogenase E1 component
LSTRPLEQPSSVKDPPLRDAVLAGYWLAPPSDDGEMTIVACGPVMAAAIAAHRQLLEVIPGAGLLVVTSPDRGWRKELVSRRGPSPASRLLSALRPDARLVRDLYRSYGLDEDAILDAAARLVSSPLSPLFPRAPARPAG